MKLTDYNKFITANWKMNGSLSLAEQFESFFLNKFNNLKNLNAAIILCPPTPYLFKFKKISKKFENFFIGAQDCSTKKNGSITGDVSSAMLKDLGCKFVILGHSERREYFKETDSIISQKIKRAIEENLKVILCVGEKEKHKVNQETFEIIRNQIINSLNDLCTPNNTIIAYEPIWAIGTGKIPSLSEIEKINLFIKDTIKLKYNNKFKDNFKILYGGSVNPNNSRNFIKSNYIDGALIGGSSLALDDFVKIIDY
tara:strand:+ start:1934 stop:2698 length:765 start_codon:yes stop_codon:yes gene_type:complete